MSEINLSLTSFFSDWSQGEISFSSSRFFSDASPETTVPLLPEAVLSSLSLSNVDDAIYDYLELNSAKEHLSNLGLVDTTPIESDLEPNALGGPRTQVTRDDRLSESVPFSTNTVKAEFKFGMSATMIQPVLYNCPIEYCPASFTRSNNMKDHLLMKHLAINVREEYPEVFLRYPKNAPKLWVCPYLKCTKAYSLKSNMLQHARGKHPFFKLPTYAQDSQRRSLPIPQEEYRPHKSASNMSPKPLPKPLWTQGNVTQVLPPISQLGNLPQAAGPPTNLFWQKISPPFIPSSLDPYMTPYPQSLLYHPGCIYAGGQMIYGLPQPSFAFSLQYFHDFY